MDGCLVRLVVVSGMAAFLAAPALSALAPEYYARARDGAAHHLEIRVTAMKRLDGRDCRVEGVVTASHRGPIAVDTPVQATVGCIRRDETVEPGPRIWVFAEDLTKGTVLEGWFDGAPSGLVSPGDQVGIKELAPGR